MKKSKLGSINWKEILEGLGLTALTAFLVGLYEIVSSGTFPTTWEQWDTILVSTCSAALAYLIKKLLTNSEGKILKREKKILTQ